MARHATATAPYSGLVLVLLGGLAAANPLITNGGKTLQGSVGYSSISTFAPGRLDESMAEDDMLAEDEGDDDDAATEQAASVAQSAATANTVSSESGDAAACAARRRERSELLARLGRLELQAAEQDTELVQLRHNVRALRKQLSADRSAKEAAAVACPAACSPSAS